MDEFHNRAKLIASGALSLSSSSSDIRSSYSLIKDSSLKPITKSKTSTTSGTFFINPSGFVEGGTGYKTESTYDSTKNEGEQWNYHESKLTQEDLERVKQTYKSGYYGLQELTNKLFPNGRDVLPDHEYRAIHRTHESTISDAKQQIPPTRGAILKTTEFNHREEQSSFGRDGGYVYDNVRGMTTPQQQQISHVSHNYDYAYQNVPPAMTSSSFGQDNYNNQREFNTGQISTTLENRQTFRDRTYDGNSIFASFKTINPRYPQECVFNPSSDYVLSGNVKEIEKFTYELSCLGTLVENSMKREINVLKQQNVELYKKIEYLEEQMRRFETNCRCY